MVAASMGFQTSFVGDLDRDGDEELALSAAKGGPAGTGMTFLFLGDPKRLDGQRITPAMDAHLRIAGDDEGAVTHRGLVGARPARDVNGDGYPDVQLSARATRNGEGRLVGSVGLLYGAARIPGGEMGFSELPVILLGQRPGSSAGFPGMNTGADLDGDGYADLLINDPYLQEQIGDSTQYRGRLWLIRGRADMPRRGSLRVSPIVSSWPTWASRVSTGFSGTPGTSMRMAGPTC